MIDSIETVATNARERHRLTSLHIFQSEDWRVWRVFGCRRDAKGVQASVEQGRGPTIREAIANLEARLIAGPINRAPWDDDEPSESPGEAGPSTPTQEQKP